MRIGSRDLDFAGRTRVMGILNVTPDSFSDGGRHRDPMDAAEHAERMILEGADILDVGGESTRPGYAPVSAGEEMRRILPAIREIRKRTDIPISVDTQKARVAEAALDAGADMVNDIWGLRRDPAMAALVAERGVPVCLMHNREGAGSRDVIADVMEGWKMSLSLAERAGVRMDRIFLDPGIGFGKTYEENLEILRRMGELGEMGFPVLIGASRKSVIGRALGLPESEREEGTIAISVLAAASGCGIVRVHDVGKNVRAIRMTEAILSSRSSIGKK